MKIQFNPEQQPDVWCEFHTKAEWDAHQYSRYYRRNVWKEGTYQETASQEPLRFPCIAFFGRTICNSNSYDEISIFFIYDYEWKES